MSKLDQAVLVALLEGIEAGTEGENPVAQWLEADASAPDALELEAALMAVEAARLMGLGAHLQQAKKSTDKRVKKAAARAIHALKSAGTAVPDAPATGGGWTLSKEVHEIPVPVGLIGLPQSDGYFPFILVAHSESGACVCAGVAGAGQGYQDADHGHVGRGQARDIIASARKDHNLFELPFHVALHLCERAFAEGARGTPHGWGHMLESVPEATRSSARLLDPLQRQETKLDRSALNDIDALTEGDTRVVFGLDKEASGPAVEACIAALTSKVEVEDSDRRRRILGVVKQSATEALAGHARGTWTLTMDVVAVLAASMGNEPLRKAARHTGLALAGGTDGGEIPFFQIWTERQLAAVSEMVMSVRSGKE
jgi:hypothetical protein